MPGNGSEIREQKNGFCAFSPVCVSVFAQTLAAERPRGGRGFYSFEQFGECGDGSLEPGGGLRRTIDIVPISAESTCIPTDVNGHRLVAGCRISATGLGYC